MKLSLKTYHNNFASISGPHELYDHQFGQFWNVIMVLSAELGPHLFAYSLTNKIVCMKIFLKAGSKCRYLCHRFSFLWLE